MRNQITFSSTISQATDKYIGLQLKECRLSKGLSQQQCGRILNISAQQMHRYETGSDSISSNKLYFLSSFFGIPINYFFEQKLQTSKIATKTRETLGVMKAFNSIPKPKVKYAILRLLQVMSNGTNTKT